MSAFFERLRAALAPDYELVRELASGGMGTVYLVRDVALNCPMAVKVLRPELWTVESADRFVEEARILARLRHPTIVPVHKVAAKHGLHFYVMDYLAGDTVKSHLERRGPLSISAARALGRDLLKALEVAHQNGVIHRDVKPANVFFDGERGVLTDFGIARRLTEEERSDPGILRGTAAYMAPEQFAGVEADERTDLYGAGMVLYEALKGVRWDKRSPKAGDWTKVPFLAAWVLQCALALEPEGRWRSATAFRRALKRTGIWPYQFRTLLLTMAGLIVGAAGAAGLIRQRLESQWPFRRLASVELYVLPFDTVGARGGAGLAGLADSLVLKLIGYPDFLVYGPGSRTWLRPNAALVLRSVVRRAGDSLRVEMEIRAGRNGQPSVITIAADSRHPDRLVDSLAFGVVRAIWNRENPLDPSLPVRALPRSSAGVLAWLAAERLFVEARWGQADSAYRAAEEIDSTCRLCYWRHREVQQWLGRDPDPALIAHYLPYLDSFPPRYQSLFRALGLPLGPRLDALRRITRQWDDFFPAWFQLADELYHRGPLVGRARSEAIEAFQMTARLRPAFGPSLEHLTWALSAEGDSSAAWAQWMRLAALGTPNDAFTVALRALLRAGYAFRFQDSTAARTVLDSALDAEGVQHFAQLAAGPRYLATFDAPRGAVVMGELFARSPDRVLQRSGLVAAAFGLVSLGQLTRARAELRRLLDRFDEQELGLTGPELEATLLLFGPDAPSASSEWLRASAALVGAAESRTLPAATRRRAAWLLMLVARQLGAPDTGHYRTLLAGEPLPRPITRLLAADWLARHGRFDEALTTSDTLTQLEAPALSGSASVDPFFRTVLHMLRADWATAVGRSHDAARELLWYQNNDVSGYLTRDPQVGDVDWAFGTIARWRRAPLLEKVDRREEACHAYRDVARLWSQGDPAYRAHADSATRRLAALGCGSGA